MSQAPSYDPVPWQIRHNVNQQALYNLLECAMEIATTMQALAPIYTPGKTVTVHVSAPQIVSTARRVSTSIRKILLDGNGALLKQCVTDPNIHPLSPPLPTPAVNFVRNFEEQSFTIGFADGKSSDITVPKLQHTTTIHALYGIQHVAKTTFALYDPFNYDSVPIKFSKWMNRKIFQIDDHTFTAERLLRDMANKEGAHIENNFAMLTTSDLPIDPDGNTLHRLNNAVIFGSLTYMQIFALYTGFYLLNRIRTMLDALPFPPTHQGVAYIRETIDDAPRTIAITSEIQITSYPLTVLDSDGNLKGDYDSDTATTLTIPN